MNNIVWKLKRAERIIGARPFLLEYNIVDFVHGAAARMFAFLFAIPLSTFVTANRRLLQRDISRALWTRRVRRIVDDAVVADDCSLHTWWHDWFAARRLACWSHRQVNIIRIYIYSPWLQPAYWRVLFLCATDADLSVILSVRGSVRQNGPT